MRLRRGLACVAVLCTVAACGGDNAERDGAAGPPVTSTEAATATTEAAATTEPDVPASSVDAFMTPSRNIVCAYLAEASVLRCDIRSGLNPPPSGECELDWTGLVLGATGPAEPQCAGDAVPADDDSFLGYGERWTRDGLDCVSSETGLECSNEEGGSFFLSRESWRAG
jgi:hypothetical protein